MRHHEIGKTRQTTANYTFKTLKAIFTFAIAFYEDMQGRPVLFKNPVEKLSSMRAWYRENRRTRAFALELQPWLRAVMSLNDTLWRDFWLLLLFTGMRKTELLTLKWEQVNVKTGVIHLKNTKTNTDRDIPLGSFMWQVVKQRRYFARANDTYVFQNSTTGKPLQATRKSELDVIDTSGVVFSCQDARRTYTSVADHFEVKQDVVALLLGHQQTMTGTYTVRSVERLRRAQQQIEDGIMHLAGQSQATEAPYVITVVPS